MSFRHYILASGGSLTEVAHEDSMLVASRAKAIPEFAGQRLRYLQVMIDQSGAEDRARIEVRVAGALVKFDDEGRLLQAEALPERDDSFTEFERETCVQLALEGKVKLDATLH